MDSSHEKDSKALTKHTWYGGYLGHLHNRNVVIPVALLLIFLIVVVLIAFNVSNRNNNRADTATITPSESITPTEDITPTTLPDELSPTEAAPPATATPTPTPKPTIVIVIPSSTPVPTATTVPPTPTHVPNPPQMEITYPTENQSIQMSSSQTFCVTDTPKGGEQSALKRRHSINDAPFTEYANQFTLCFDPKEGLNRFQLQYKNSYGEESPTYTRQFNFHRTTI